MSRSATLVATLLLVAGCGSADGAGSSTGGAAPSSGDEPLTAQALAAVVAEHLAGPLGEPTSARPATDLEELGKGLVAAVELRYPDPDDAQSDGDVVLVGVGTGFERYAPDCRTLLDQGLSGCERAEGGLLFWEEAAPEEDPGVVHLLVAKGRTDVLLLSSGPEVSGDPRQREGRPSVDDLAAIAADPRVDLTTSRQAVEAGRELATWSDSAP